jgi:hypothetical protein
MAITTFSDMVRRHFRFLIDEYGFSVKEDLYGSEPMDGGRIEFRSLSTILFIELDRGGLSNRIGPIVEPEVGWSSLEMLVEFFTNGKDTSLVDVSKRGQYTYESWIEFRLIAYQFGARKYCEPFLRGDFSQWLEIQKWFLEKMEDEYHDKTGLEFPQNQRYTKYLKSKEINKH